jgi:L-ribulose-5-phosphate 4-epimerase
MTFRPTPDRLLPDLDPRLEMVLLARTLWHEGYDDHLAGHITHNLGDGTLLCNPWYLTWDEFRPEDVIRIDLEGNVLEGDWPAPLGIPLHLELHKARPGVGMALHHHPRWGVIWADMGRVPERMDQSAALGGGSAVLVDEYDGTVNDPASARKAIERMGDADIAVLAHHGVFVLGRNVRAVHQRAVAFEWRCRTAWLAGVGGGGSELPGPLLELFGRGDGDGFVGFWEAMARRELRADPSLLLPAAATER